ncbi:hypothetical protein [Chitiniphilus shinanonensis]|uniref:hypothetical protein n=1 Tax=Chitiniphilus shinanonensis TaxID=553088 RepID=UPI00303B5606
MRNYAPFETWLYEQVRIADGVSVPSQLAAVRHGSGGRPEMSRLEYAGDAALAVASLTHIEPLTGRALIYGRLGMAQRETVAVALGPELRERCHALSQPAATLLILQFLKTERRRADHGSVADLAAVLGRNPKTAWRLRRDAFDVLDGWYIAAMDHAARRLAPRLPHHLKEHFQC